MADWQPISVTLDSVFDALDSALQAAVQGRGNEAKAIAFDIHCAMMARLGKYRFLSPPPELEQRKPVEEVQP